MSNWWVADQRKDPWLGIIDNIRSWQSRTSYHDSCFGNEDFDVDVEGYKIRRQRKIWKLQTVTLGIVKIWKGYFTLNSFVLHHLGFQT